MLSIEASPWLIASSNAPRKSAAKHNKKLVNIRVCFYEPQYYVRLALHGFMSTRGHVIKTWDLKSQPD